ncbi:MAG: hypothetical protein JSV91_06830 [Phycisphaerales bacterium]|nr:MAG: hypothetical protein JSV91_06830 [Phycisphaerales bacterium]
MMHSRAFFPMAVAAAAVATFSGLSGPVLAQEEDVEAVVSYSLLADLSVELRARYMRGNVDGYLQTPSGGQPGTSDFQRPTFGEIGYHNEDVWDASVVVQSHEHLFNFGARLIRMEGDARLTQDLICENIIYPAGTEVDSSILLDWFRLGYRYEFAIESEGNGSRFAIAPGAEAVLFNFDFDMTAPGNLRSDRNYSKGGLRIGATLDWQISGPFSIQAAGWWPVPMDNTARIMSVEVVGRYEFWGGRRMGSAFYLGVAYDEIQYEDQQTLPNDVRVEMGPMIIAGFDFRF